MKLIFLVPMILLWFWIFQEMKRNHESFGFDVFVKCLISFGFQLLILRQI